MPGLAGYLLLQGLAGMADDGINAALANSQTRAAKNAMPINTKTI